VPEISISCGTDSAWTYTSRSVGGVLDPALQGRFAQKLFGPLAQTGLGRSFGITAPGPWSAMNSVRAEERPKSDRQRLGVSHHPLLDRRLRNGPQRDRRDLAAACQLADFVVTREASTINANYYTGEFGRQREVLVQEIEPATRSQPTFDGYGMPA